MRIAVIGTGYVGLVSGVCFSDSGNDVVCIDTDTDKISQLKTGKIPIYEPGLSELVNKNVMDGRLQFDDNVASHIELAEVIFLAVGTPPNSDGSANLNYIYQATKDIAPLIRNFTVVVIKSTVPVGTGDVIQKIISEVNPAAKFAVVSNPEFLREGSAINDFKHPDRIIIGLDDDKARAIMKSLYQSPYYNQAPIIFTTRRSAELIKYASNAFLAMKITFINEIADLCEEVGGDIQEVSKGIGSDSRIGMNFLNAGPGYGGSCFPKDTLALSNTANSHNSPIKLITTTIEINELRKSAMTKKIVSACGGTVKDKIISILGIAFKPNTDDVRYSPAITIINELIDLGAKIKCTDPEAINNARNIFENVTFYDNPYSCADKSDCLVLVTEWSQYNNLNFSHLYDIMNEQIFIDLRNVYNKVDVIKHGFNYVSIGR